MKKSTWPLVALLIGCTTLIALAFSTPRASTAGESGIRFTEGNWKSILSKAKAEKKIIFLDAYTSWCGPCKTLQKEVFTKKAVGDVYNAKFINVKIDMEKGEGPVLSEVYPLEFYPTLLFIDGNGKLVRKVVGLQTPDDLIAIGKSIH